MREIKYLSPSSIACFYSDVDEFYMRYLCENRPPRPKQTRPMSIGSAFDAFVKSHLYQCLVGKSPEYDKQTLFEEQVEEHNRDWAWDQGQIAFDKYKESGALADLLLDLSEAQSEPRFETTVKGTVAHNDQTVDLLGKPDVYFTNKEGHPVILDWKVNGWCSNWNTSPKKGYIRIRGSQTKGPHKDAIIMVTNGVRINVFHNLEDVDETWARQLAIYGWLLGEDVGEQFIVGIDQLVGNPDKLRIAEHRTRISKKYQEGVFLNAISVKNVVESKHIFQDVELDQSIERCISLDARAKAFSEADETFLEFTR